MKYTFRINKDRIIEKFKEFSREKSDVNTQNIGQESPGTAFFILSKIRDLYKFVIENSLLELRRFFIDDDEKFSQIKNEVENHINNKIKSTSEGKLYLKINNSLKFNGDYEQYLEWILKNKDKQDLVIRNVINELNSFFAGDIVKDKNKSILYDEKISEEKSIDVDSILRNIKEETLLELAKGTFENFDKEMTEQLNKINYSPEQIKDVLENMHTNTPEIFNIYKEIGIEEESKTSEKLS